MASRGAQGAESQALVARAQAGDVAAFEELVRLNLARIHRWALARTGDPDDADDVLQGVLVRLHAGLRAYRGGARFTTWLYRVTMNAAAESGRRAAAVARKQKRLALLAPAPDPPGDPPPERPLSELVRAFLTELTPAQRQVLDLVDLQGYEPVEVAAMLEMNDSTVRAHLFKARRTLRARILTAHPTLLEEYR